MKAPSDVVASESSIRERVDSIGRAIRKESGSEPVLLLGVLKGAAVFLGDLLRTIEDPVSFDFIDVIRDKVDTEAADAVEIDFLTHFDLKGRRVYLLKDVVSTGVIENYLLQQLRQRGPAELKLVALLDRSDSRTMPLRVDYSGFVVGDETFVGYGLEHEGRHGNLPYIAKL
jgi:hypoxanthine phosphoribosyltransferase